MPTDDKTTEPQPGHIWISGSRYVPQREVIDIVPGGWSTLVKYRRGNEGGSRTCSMEAWNAWARRNVATVKETTTTAGRDVIHSWEPHPLPALEPRADGARWWRGVEYANGKRGRQVSADMENWKDESDAECF